MALVNLHTLPGLGKVGGAGFSDIPKFPEFPDFGDVSAPAPSMDVTGGSPGTAFADILTQAIDQVNAQEHRADNLSIQAATGNDVDPHTLMIETAKAETMVHLTSSIATKTAQNVQTIMNMQI